MTGDMPRYIIVHRAEKVTMVAFGHKEVAEYMKDKGLEGLEAFKKRAERGLLAAARESKAEVVVARDKSMAFDVAMMIAVAE